METNVYSHTFLLVWEPRRKLDCTSMLWSIDSCQSRVSTDQYHLTVSCAQVSTHWGRVFFWSLHWQVTSFQMIAGSSIYIFKLCHYGPALLRFWFQINLGRENSASYLEMQAGKTFCYQGHALVTLYVQFLCSDWSKFDRWVHAENLCSILKLVYFDSWSWQSFVSTCDVFNCLFPLNVRNEIQLLSRVFCYSWLVCLLGFWLRNTSLVKVGNPISDGIVFVFHLAWCVRGLQSLKRYWPYLIPFRSCISNGKPE